ncbi:pentapeptide repeat-containing protein [Streptomyces sp. NPDC002553]|uniref:pentapeptide repeat-containing protein n=1 Tax=Streptomyces sp. NPDC002553 TaxID=3154417 RepID=UPI003329BCF7
MRIDPYDRCIAHLSPHERNSYLSGLLPGSNLNFSGVTFTQELLNEVLATLRQLGAFQEVHFSNAQLFGSVNFSEMAFQGACWFDNTVFHEAATFERASFQSSACFLRCRFEDSVSFKAARFGDLDFSGTYFANADFSDLSRAGSLNFSDATFDNLVSFEGSQIKAAHFHRARFCQSRFWNTRFATAPYFRQATFTDHASFEQAEFDDGADFSETKHTIASFSDATFSGVANFTNATFESANFANSSFESSMVCSMAYATEALGFTGCTFRSYFSGPIRAKHVLMINAVFQRTVRIEAAAEYLFLNGAKFEASAAFHVRHATVELSDAHPNFPITIATHSDPFTSAGATLREDFDRESNPIGRVNSLRGLDAALIVLNDIDLRQCTFDGAYHLDQISLEGRCRFSAPPRGIKWGKAWVPLRIWTQRKVLEEERAWRATMPTTRLDRHGWGIPIPPNRVADSQNIAATYRQLRKALEDRLNEPGAADFYYGEMEMRRRDQEISRSERGLLHAYWALSGYGLRASRSIGWLFAAMGLTVFLMMGWGLPGAEIKQQASGVISPPGKKTTLVVEKPNPSLHLSFNDRFTGKRLEKAGQVVLNSVIFKSSGQDLTTAGTWIEMVSRFTEPVLLGFAALAVRGRIKRS